TSDITDFIRPHMGQRPTPCFIESILPRSWTRSQDALFRLAGSAATEPRIAVKGLVAQQTAAAYDHTGGDHGSGRANSCRRVSRCRTTPIPFAGTVAPDRGKRRDCAAFGAVSVAAGCMPSSAAD